MDVQFLRYFLAVAQQQEDGWICPCSLEERPNYDVWALFLLCKVLVVYEECSQDPRVEEAVYRALRNLHSHIEVHTLFDWAAARWFECLIPIYWLYERRPEDWLLDLAHALRVEGFDNGLCHEVPDSRVPLTPPQQVRLIPYGCTNLRMTEMPWIQAESPT